MTGPPSSTKSTSPPEGCWVAAAAARWPSAVALEVGHQRYTFSEVDQRVSATVQALVGQGLKPGDVLAAVLPRDERLLILVSAAQRCGLLICPVNLRLPAEGLKQVMQVIAPTAVVAAYAIKVDGAIWLHPEQVIRDEPATDGCPDRRPQRGGGTLVFTSGNSGLPKAAYHTWLAHGYSAQGVIQALEIGAGDRYLLALPLYHVGGLALWFRCLLAGATLVIPPHAFALADVLETDQITHVSLVSTQLVRLLGLPQRPALDKLKAIHLGGSAMPRRALTEALAREWPIHTSYGMTEMASTIALTPRGETAIGTGDAGRVLPHRALRIDHEGAVWVRGATRMEGFWNAGVLERPFDAEGWYFTGDLGRREHNRVFITGRADNRFVSGGENIQAEEIENALMAIEDVESVVVVPVPDVEFGHRPVAFIKMEQVPIPEEKLRKRLALTLPKYKIPDHFFPWWTPGSGGLKVSRALLSRRALELVAPHARRAEDRASHSP